MRFLDKQWRHRCGPSIMIGRTRGDVRAKVRKQRKVWSARRARWRIWMKFGVDWNFVKQQSRIAEIKHSRRVSSKQKCKIIDADDRMMKKLKVKKLLIHKQPVVCVKPCASASNVEDKMFNDKSARASQVKRKASSKRNALGMPSSYFLRTSPDVVTHFFFPFNGCGKVASRKKLSTSKEDTLGIEVSNFFY